MSTYETVRAWQTTNAGNASADSAITSGDSQAPNTLDDNVRSIMVAVRKQENDTGGALVAGGLANALTATTSQGLESGQLVNGLRLLVQASAANTAASVTFAPDGLPAAGIKRADGSPLAVGSIASGMYLDLAYHAATSEWWAVNLPPAGVAVSGGAGTGQIFGLTLSNDSGGTTAIAVAAGSARDSTDVDTMTLAAPLTGKVLANPWSAGSSGGLLDTGTVGNATYHMHLIKRPDTGAVDLLASLSPVVPTLPASYTMFRRIGSIMRVAGAIVLFRQNGDDFHRSVSSLDGSVNAPGAAILQSLSIPSGIVIRPIVILMLQGGANSDVLARLADASATNVSDNVARSTSGVAVSSGPVSSYYSNTSAQIYWQTVVNVGIVTSSQLITIGWLDQRGRVY
jgi:hypothetical protein